MATVKILKNILDSKVDTFSVDEGITIEALIREHTDGDVYDGTLVECYDLETGKTFFAPIEESPASINAIVQVNGKDAALDYTIKENDIVGIVITPAGGGGGGVTLGFDLIGAIGGAITGALIGFMAGGVVGAVFGAFAGLVVGGLITGTLIETMKNQMKDNKSESGLDSERLPDTRGASNQPLLDQTYPFVLGKHLVAPFIIGSPWNEISGLHGEENYIQILYAVGYAPLRLTDFKLGDMFVAHNQRWSGNPDMKNIFHGKLHGTDSESGSGQDLGDITNIWKNNDITIEILQQGQGKKEDINPYYQSKTQIDLAHRPLIDAATMRSAGWTEVEDGEIATVYSTAYSNTQETYTVLVTPILSNGTVLSPAQIENIANEIIAGTSHPEVFLADFTGADSIQQSNEYAKGLHENQEAYYFGEDEVDYGEVYPYAKIQEEVKANILYIADGSLVDIDRGSLISYKGLGLQNGLRNNHIHYTEQFAKSATVELDFPNGMYKSRSETSDKTSRVKYYKIPMWTAIQWRVYSEENPKADGSVGGELPIPEYDYVNHSYVSAQRGWFSFDTVNNVVNSTVFTAANRNSDIDAHTGNNLKPGGVYTPINQDWIGTKVFNLESFGGTNSETDGINEFRCITKVDFVEWARNNLLTPEEIQSGDEGILAEKFRAFFYDGSNTTKSIEVRVVRISPCYLDETVSTNDNSAFKFNDVFTWATITSEVLDGDELTANTRIVQKRPLTEDRMRKLCVISLRAKTDHIDQLTNTIKKFTCIAQSFAPYYDVDTKRWVPEKISKKTRYFKPSTQDPLNPKVWIPGEEITEQQFYQDRQNGIKSIRSPNGNDFIKQIVDNYIRIPEHMDSLNRYFIPYDDKTEGQYDTGCDGTLNFCTNLVSSMFVLAGVGPLLGVDALGYEQNYYDETTGELKNDFGDFNMVAIAKWGEELKELEDGSVYPNDGYHYNQRGERISHHAGETVKMFFAANAYIYSAELLENILAKIAIAGRAVYTRDGKSRFTVIMDKPEKYPVALINQQNTLKSSYTLSYQDLPSGLQIVFPDEADGYIQNNIYCMVDGENADNPRGAIEQYKFDYVTNNYQQNSLGRYLLANRILNKEVVTKQLGIEGASIGLGSLVLVSDDRMLIGTDTGGRIVELIENEDTIYGVVINNTFHYTGEEEDVDGVIKCKQGIQILQPSKYKEARVITLRLAKKGTTYTVDGKTYRAVKGNTNTVLFDTPIAKTEQSQDGTQYYVYQPEVDNIVSFGIIGQITATYRVTKIKSDNKRHYDFTLIKYQEELYNYGRILPSFQNNMTNPDRTGEDAYALSENATQADLVKTLAAAGEQTNGVINGLFGQIPAVPNNFTANVKKDCIQFNCAVNSTDINNLDYILYEITRADSSVVTMKGSYSTEYYFNRSVDGYPEKNELGNWSFRCKAVSVYTDENNNRIESDWTDPISLTTESLNEYGTWKIPNITVNKEVVDRTVIFTVVYNESSTPVYGNIRTLVKVRRIGNTDPIGDTPTPTFNTMLGVTPDEDNEGNPIFYEPEFNEPVQYDANEDYELNYRTNDTSKAFETPGNKITQTLPLIGQTDRIFKSGNIFTGILSKDVPDVDSLSELPHTPPQEGDCIHWITDTRTEAPLFEKNGYYYYENGVWIQVYSKSLIVPTTYEYQIQMVNEAGPSKASQVRTISVTALCTNIADIVHSHEHYKDLYVEKLSAISANIGLIQQGGMGTFDKDNGNYWALSDLSPEDSGVVGGIKKGSFRVGGIDQFFKVEPDPNDPTKFKIELRAGSINLTTEQDKNGFINGTYIYQGAPELSYKRLALTASGMIAQERDDLLSNDWVEIAKVIIDGKGNLIISNSDETPPFGYKVNGSVYHFDSTATLEENENGNNPENIQCTGVSYPTQDTAPLLLSEGGSQYCIQGTVEKNISAFEGKIVVLSKATGFEIDRQFNIDGSITPTANTYNSELKQPKGAGTVGSYLGLTSSQISNGIFE